MSTRSFARLLALPVIAGSLCATACRTQMVDPVDRTAPSGLVAAAAGVGGSVEFSFTGGPDDVPGEAVGALPVAACVEAALRTDPRLQQALARWHGALAASDGARLLPNPLVSVGFSLAKALADASITVGISQQIAAYLERPHKAAAADARMRAAAEEALVVALDVVADARAAYLAVEVADARRPALVERRSALVQLRDLHAQSVEFQEGLPSDVTALEAELAAVELSAAELDAVRARARIDLARIMGRPSAPGEWTVAPWPPLPAVAGNEKAWIDAALSRRPEVRAIGWELAALDLDRALIATWPWDGASVGADVGYDSGLELGPSVEIPLRLFDPSGPRNAAITAAQAELRHRAVGVRRDAIRDVRAAVADDVAARRALDLVDRSLIPLLERRRTEIERAHRAGETPITQLLLADRELKDARASRVDLEARVLSARIRLERAAGGPARAPLRKPGPPESAEGGTQQ